MLCGPAAVLDSGLAVVGQFRLFYVRCFFAVRCIWKSSVSFLFILVRAASLSLRSPFAFPWIR